MKPKFNKWSRDIHLLYDSRELVGLAIIRKMIRRTFTCTLIAAIELLAILVALPSEARPKLVNYLYSSSYDYNFKGEPDVTKCISRASAALAKQRVGESLDSEINKDRQYGSVWGWSADGTASAEITCDRKKKESVVMFAEYSDNPDNTLRRWKTLENSKW